MLTSRLIQRLAVAIFVVFVIGATTQEVLAQAVNAATSAGSTLPDAAEVNRNSSPPTGTHSQKVTWLSSQEFALSLSVLIFGIFVVAQQTFVIRKSQFEANDIIKIFGLTFIIIATLFIITAGYDSEQIAPAMGLFGTIAGYILGRNTRSKGGE